MNVSLGSIRDGKIVMTSYDKLMKRTPPRAPWLSCRSEEALALPPKDRLLIAAELHQSIENSDSPEEIQAAWLDEIAERVQSIADGTAELVDGNEVSRRIRARYGP